MTINKRRGELEVKLGDKVYKARLNIDAMVRIEEKIGKGLIKIAQDMGDQNVTITTALYIVLQGVRGGGNDISDKDLKASVNDCGISELYQAMAEIMASTIAREEEQEDIELGNEQP